MSSTTATPRISIPNERARLHFVNSLWRLLPHVLIILIVALGAFLAHELGHALVATLFGARVVMFNVLGMQWYPLVEWRPQLGFGGYVSWWAPPDRNLHWLIVMAGSNFTMLLAFVAVMGLNLFQPRGLIRTALASMSFYFLDSFVKILPILGFIPSGWSSRFTRSFSEAYYAATGLGIPSQIYIGAILILSALIALLLVRALRR